MAIRLAGRVDWSVGSRLCGQGADLDQVVGQDAVSGPDSGAFGAVDAGTVPAIAAFEVTDAAFAAGSPFDEASEGLSVFFGAPFFGRFALAGDYHVFHTEVGELVVDAGFAVAAVGGDRAGRLSGPLLDPRHGRGQLRRVGGLPCSTV